MVVPSPWVSVQGISRAAADGSQMPAPTRHLPCWRGPTRPVCRPRMALKAVGRGCRGVLTTLSSGTYLRQRGTFWSPSGNSRGRFALALKLSIGQGPCAASRRRMGTWSLVTRVEGVVTGTWSPAIMVVGDVAGTWSRAIRVAEDERMSRAGLARNGRGDACRPWLLASPQCMPQTARRRPCARCSQGRRASRHRPADVSADTR